jgi:ribosomal protein S6
MEPKVEYIIELLDDNDCWIYNKGYCGIISFECEPEAEARVLRLFKQDPNLLVANILRVEKTKVKTLRNAQAE